MAKVEHLAVLRLGSTIWNSWRDADLKAQLAAIAEKLSPDEYPNIERADLKGAKLRNENLSGFNLSGANFSGADLSGADMAFSNLHGAYLRGANLYDANLESAILWGADLTGADLRKAHLYGTAFTAARVEKAMFEEAVFGLTELSAVDLSSAIGLEKVDHAAPSSIGIDTLYESKGCIPVEFLRGAGVPDDFIGYMLDVVRERPIAYYSCFISHSSRDKDFCDRLNSDLLAQGIRCWYFPEQASFGRGVWDEIDRSIRSFDKMILVCSRNSLESGPVLREINRALMREDESSRDVLFPIRIDDYIFSGWQHALKADVLAKVVGDFSGWEQDDDKYRVSLARLVGALNAIA